VDFGVPKEYWRQTFSEYPARTTFSEDGVVGDHLRQLSLFSDKDEAIRQSLDTGGDQAKASSETDELENSLMRWLESRND
jgi:hypothetical protein